MSVETNPGTERITNSGNAASDQLFLQDFPPVPEDVKARFPSMIGWEQALKVWVKQAVFNIRGAM